MSNKSYRKEMRHELEKRLLPIIFEKGFEQLYSKEKVFPLGKMKRVRGTNIDLVEIRFDRYMNPKFVIDFGTVYEKDMDAVANRFNQEELNVFNDCSESYCLYARKFPPALLMPDMTWFGTCWLPFNKERKIKKAVDRAIKLFPEIDAWFDRGEVGRHIHVLLSSQHKMQTNQWVHTEPPLV